MVGVDLADGVAVLGEVKLDGGRGVAGFESADLGLGKSFARSAHSQNPGCCARPIAYPADTHQTLTA
jgi:hypothetical protein